MVPIAPNHNLINANDKRDTEYNSLGSSFYNLDSNVVDVVFDVRPQIGWNIDKSSSTDGQVAGLDD